MSDPTMPPTVIGAMVILLLLVIMLVGITHAFAYFDARQKRRTGSVEEGPVPGVRHGAAATKTPDRIDELPIG